MASAQTQTTANGTANNNTNGNGQTTAASKSTKPMTHIEAASKITKILDKLNPFDRKRVLAFVAESIEASE